MNWNRGSRDGPELASFVRDLHTAQGAGSVFDLAFSNAIDRLLTLSFQAEEERVWVREMEQRLSDLASDIADSPDAVTDLLDDAKGILSWVEHWCRTREKLYYQST